MVLSTYSNGRPQDDDSLAYLFDSDDENLPAELKNAPPPGPSQPQEDSERLEGYSDSEAEEEEGGENDAKRKKAAAKKPAAFKRARFDEQVLMSEKGIKELLQQVKAFKFKGDGYEAEDLRGLMQIYRFWSANLTFLYQFNDFIAAVQRKSGSKVLRSYLDRLAAEMNPKSSQDDEDFVLNVNSDNEPVGEMGGNRSIPNNLLPASNTREPTEAEVDDMMNDTYGSGSTSSRPTTLSSTPTPVPGPAAASIPLSPGTLERMRENRLKALTKRLQRQREQKEEAERVTKEAQKYVSSIMFPRAKLMKVRPPDKGSFPLDHEGRCKQLKEQYMECLKANGNDNTACREVSMAYLNCRMENELMAPEDLGRLGFKDLIASKAGKDNEKQPTTV